MNVFPAGPGERAVFVRRTVRPIAPRFRLPRPLAARGHGRSLQMCTEHFIYQTPTSRTSETP